MKKIAWILLTAILLTSFTCTTSFAATPSDSLIQPLWINTGTIDYMFKFPSTEHGYAEIAVVGQFGVNKIQGAITIYRQYGSDWIFVTSGSEFVDEQTFLLSVPIDNGISGAYYKAHFVVQVFKNGVCETITEDAYATCP